MGLGSATNYKLQTTSYVLLTTDNKLLTTYYCAPDPEAASREIRGDAGRHREI